jgi:hypothetical protein
MDDTMLREIAESLDAGYIVFVHRRTFELLSYPDPAHWSELDALDEWAAIKDRLDTEAADFVEISPPPSKESYQIMQDFAQQVQDARLRERLFEALRSPKPFRHFRHMVEESEEADAWAEYRLARIKEYALERLAEAWD